MAVYCGLNRDSQEVRTPNNPMPYQRLPTDITLDGEGGLTQYFESILENSQGEFPNSPCILTTKIQETPVTVVEETASSQMNRDGNNPATKANTKTMKITKAKTSGIPLRTAQLLNVVPTTRWRPPEKKKTAMTFRFQKLRIVNRTIVLSP